MCLRLDAPARLARLARHTHLPHPPPPATARHTHLPRCAAAAPPEARQPAPPLAATRESEGEREGGGGGEGEGEGEGEGGRAVAAAARRAVAARVAAQLEVEAAAHAGGGASLEAMAREAVREAARPAARMATAAVAMRRCTEGRRTLRLLGLDSPAGLAGACGAEGGVAEMWRGVEGVSGGGEAEERCFALVLELMLRRVAQETLALLPLPGDLVAGPMTEQDP